MLATMAITFIGSLGCVLAQEEWMLIVFRLLTGVGMGGEYPLASTHASRNTKNKAEAARNVGLLYLFGNGLGTASCSLFVYLMLSNCPASHKDPVTGAVDQAYKNATWRGMFGVSAALSFIGLVLRYFTTKSEEEHEGAQSDAPPARRVQWAAIGIFINLVIASAGGWFLYDFVEYGLKANDAKLFSGDKISASGALSNFESRITGVPFLILATIAAQVTSMKVEQSIGFLGCGAICVILAAGYSSMDHEAWFPFKVLYLFQYGFQQFCGVTTMAIAAEVFPSHFAGTGAGIAAGSGKIGASVGIFLFAVAWPGKFSIIFGVSAGVSIAGLLLTFVLTPHYGKAKLDRMQELADQGDEVGSAKALYSPLTSVDIEKPLK